VEADESATSAERCSDLSRAGHSRGHPLQLEEGVAVAARSQRCQGPALSNKRHPPQTRVKKKG
jgi:hypothetical protein